MSRCRGQVYDGASNMSGHLSEVAAWIEKDVPAALAIFALFCSLCKLVFTIKEVYINKRCYGFGKGDTYHNSYNFLLKDLLYFLKFQLGTSSVSLKPLCPMRWTVRTAAFSGVLSNYEILQATLEKINSETHDEYG